MTIGPRQRRNCASRRRGAALVIVLAFVVLLTGVVVAYFSRSMTDRQLSNSSFSQARADELARSAADIIIADLKQEIVNGSVTPAPAPASGVTLYFPSTTANMVPVRHGVPSPAPSPVPPATATPDPFANLIRRSVRPSFSPSPLPPMAASRASAVNSTNDPSVNQRVISAKRWNSHYLIGRATGVTADTDTTPFAGFESPDWVFVTKPRDGVSPPVGGPTLITTPTSDVVGRYAYAVYDEGGLLDLNVVGYPTNSAPTQYGYKPAAAYADLAQIGLSDSAKSSPVNDLIGWRNYASMQATGAFTQFTPTSFSASDAARYFDLIVGNTTGFMKTGGAVWTDGTTPVRTDQIFLSRQQLLSYQRATGFSPNALQYLTHFSRSLEQPSFRPNAERPRIVAPTEPAPASDPTKNPNPALSYKGNNDAAGSDDAINPSPPNTTNPMSPNYPGGLLSLRVTAGFPRNDGSTAVAGEEPLVKRRFSLNKLSWITYDGPSASRNIPGTDPGTTDRDYDMWSLVNTHSTSRSFLQQGTAANIKKYFGLSWDATNRWWVYDHGSLGGRVIARLDDLLATREPDFLELLKAGINVGSLGKAGATNFQGDYQYSLDRSVDLHLLTIMANIIDQCDVDSYPTRIRIAFGSTVRTVVGSEDLPYFYRTRLFSVMTRPPNPQLLRSDTVTFKGVSSRGQSGSKADITVPYAKPKDTQSGSPPTIQTIALTDPGEATLLYVPEVWNPYDTHTADSASKALRPGRFRLLAVTADPGTPPTQWQVAAEPRFENGSAPSPAPQGYQAPAIPNREGTVQNSPNNYISSAKTSPYTVLTENNSALEFSDNVGTLFREPTLLWRTTAPTNSAVTLGQNNALAAPVSDSNNPTKKFVGILVGRAPISVIGHVKYDDASPKSTSDDYIFQGTSVWRVDTAIPGVSGAFPGNFTYRVQYEYPSGSNTWFTYDEKFAGTEGATGPTIYVNKSEFPNNDYMNPMNGAMTAPTSAYDPRTARFGMGTAGTTMDGLSKGPAPEVDTRNFSVSSSQGNAAVGTSDFTVLVTQRSKADRGQSDYYMTPGFQSQSAQMRWFSGTAYYATIQTPPVAPLFYDGLLSQNNPAITIPDKLNTPGSQAHVYYEDADGIARRAMGAYAATSLTGSLDGLPLATANDINAVGIPSAKANGQSQNRPAMLNRPLRSAAELGYVFRGVPWKNLDFFTPESGDGALLDLFSISDSPADSVVAGKVNLNTRQIPVIKAVIAGAYRESLANSGSTLTGYTASALGPAEAERAATNLSKITSSTMPFQGPLTNISEIVGRYVANPGSTSGATDVYSFTETITNTPYVYEGFSASLDAAVFTGRSAAVQRLHESAIRPLANIGQTRVWNLMIDVIAQAGRYPPNVRSASELPNFVVEGEKRYWVHVAIDRFTGNIIDKQIELVSE